MLVNDARSRHMRLNSHIALRRSARNGVPESYKHRAPPEQIRVRRM